MSEQHEKDEIDEALDALAESAETSTESDHDAPASDDAQSDEDALSDAQNEGRRVERLKITIKRLREELAREVEARHAVEKEAHGLRVELNIAQTELTALKEVEEEKVRQKFADEEMGDW